MCGLNVCPLTVVRRYRRAVRFAGDSAHRRGEIAILISGDPTPPEQRGMPFPAVKFALAVPRDRDELPVLHSYPCADLPEHRRAAAKGLREIVYSTTYDELMDYAWHDFGEDGWCSCHICGG